MSTTAGLNLSGKFFFSGLCVGTFYLGCWQTQRYFEKISLMDQRKKDLALDPEPLLKTDNELALQGFRRRLVEGRYRHGEEMLMGPRGPPPGALLVASGPASGRSEGGMSSGPQVRIFVYWQVLLMCECVCVCVDLYNIMINRVTMLLPPSNRPWDEHCW